MSIRARIRPRRAQGFTLLEAMIVVAIVGISAALAAPALSTAMADRRAGDATHSLVRIGARARSEAMVLGRAHVLAFDAADNGRAHLWRGRTNLCNFNPWATLTAGSCDGNPSCVDALDMATYDHGHHQVRMQLVSTTPWLCFQPDGEVLFSVGATSRFNPLALGQQGVLVNIDRLAGGSAAGVRRQVVFPLGGSPRIVR